MENVTEETSNPFGFRIDGSAVYGYGDANADFHVVGDHPGVHGGVETGVPFTGTTAGERLLVVLREVDFVGPGVTPTPANCYRSYVHPSVPDGTPTEGDYLDAERFLDAELRAINAHVLLPVGDRALEYVLEEHTSRAHRLPADAAALHARQLRGRGFLVVPVKDPVEWTDGDSDSLLAALREILASDYRQTKGVATTIG